MLTTFGAITQLFIKAKLFKNNTRVLALLFFYETRADKIAYRVLSCAVYTIIKNYVCIDDLACQLKKLSKITVGSGRVSKHGDKSFDRILGIGITDLLMNLMSCHIILKNINTFVMIKCPKRMLEYYFSKGCTILECNYNNLTKLPNDVKQITHAEETDNSDKFMTCINKIPSTSNTLNNLVVNKVFILPIFKENSKIKRK